MSKESWNERRELARSFLARQRLSADEMTAFFSQRYPSASQNLLQSASFHLLDELPDAMSWLMAELELCLRDPKRELNLHGHVSDLIYHLYNYSLLAALIPTASQNLMDLVAELRACVQDKDPEGVSNTLARLEELVGGSAHPPDLP